MDFTAELSKVYGVTPFEIFKQDKDSVIMLINYYIEKGQNTGEKKDTESVGVFTTEKEKDRQFWAAL